MSRIDLREWSASIVYFVHKFFFADMEEDLFKMMAGAAFLTFWVFFSVGLALGAPKWLAMGGSAMVPVFALIVVRLTHLRRSSTTLDLAPRASVADSVQSAEHDE